MSDWNLYGGPLAHPGVCICGGQNMPMVDTMMERPRGFRIYLCTRCVRLAASLHSYVEPEVADEMLAEIARLHGQIVDLEARVEAAEDPGAKVVQVTVKELLDAIDRKPAETTA